MAEYSHRGTCAVPVALVPVANAIWRALDPDVGGDASFDILRATDKTGAEYTLTSALCTEAFAAQAPYLIAHPQALHSVVIQDYALRWEGLEPPSLADVMGFCGAARIVVTMRDDYLEAHLAELGMSLVSPA